MNTHDHSAKKQVDGSTTDTSYEEQQPNNVSGLGDFYALQRAIKKPSPEMLTPNAVLQLQRIIGNRATIQLTRQHHAAGLEVDADIVGNKTFNTTGGAGETPLKSKSDTPLMQIIQRVNMHSNITFNDKGELNVLGNTAPENKAQSLNTMFDAKGVTDASVANSYQNGHMVAAMFGGQNQGENIRVWSDTYEDIHTELEKKVRYGKDATPPPVAKEAGKITVDTKDVNNRFDAFVDGLYNVVQNQLSLPGFWLNRNVPANPKDTMIKRLKGANVHKAVNAIPSEVKFSYKDNANARTFETTTNAGLGNPVAAADAQTILNSLAVHVNTLIPDGLATLNAKNPVGKAKAALFNEINNLKQID